MLLDRFGRRKVVLASSVLFVVSGLALALAPSFWWLVLARWVIGLAIGTASEAVPVYVRLPAPRTQMRPVSCPMDRRLYVPCPYVEPSNRDVFRGSTAQSEPGSGPNAGPAGVKTRCNQCS